jgi:hypothetical protein
MDISTRDTELNLEYIREIFALSEAVKEYSAPNRVFSQRLVTDHALSTRELNGLSPNKEVELRRLARECLAVDRATDLEAEKALDRAVRKLKRTRTRSELLVPLTKGITQGAQGVLEGMTMGLWRG